MHQIKIGGVPEHFNLPWQLSIEEGVFSRNNLNVNWKDYPGGTGAMMADLENGSLDLAVVLTEGAVNAISKDNPSVIVGAFIKSPLIWGIHVPAKSSIQSINEIQGKTYAISRYGSGSHLMAFIDVRSRNWNPEDLKFQEVKDIQGARNSFEHGNAQVFMWEKFMTKPLVDSGEFRLVGQRPTPWPCFVMVASKAFINDHSDQLKKIQELIYSRCKNFQENKTSAQLVAERFNLKLKDAAEWFSKTQWADKPFLQGSDLKNIIENLYELGLLNKKLKPEDLTIPNIITND